MRNISYMFVYGPEHILPERLKKAASLLASIPAKHAFIAGSFLHSKTYNDIDVFVLSRKRLPKIAGVDVHRIDFNQASSLFYHSLTQSCVSKGPLPKPKLRTTLAAYWEILNDALTPMHGEYDLHKHLRTAILHTLYHDTGRVPDSKMIAATRFRSRDEFERWVLPRAARIFQRAMSASYRKRFFTGLQSYYRGAHPSISNLVRLARAPVGANV